jgi:VWFA-related protein
MKSKPLLALLLSFCIFLPALAQTDKDDVVKITTNLVQIDAVVTKDGKPVSNLTVDDFEIYQDGRKQAITSFAYISNVPNSTPPPTKTTKNNVDVVPYLAVKPNEARRIMAFVVDDLGLSADSMMQVRRQLRKFVAEQLQPNDLVAIIRTGGEMGALQQFTNDKRLLSRAADQLRWNICNRVGLSVLRPVGGISSGPNVCGFRSIDKTLKSLRFIVDAMGYLPGRKSLVFLSDSLPREDQDELLAELQSMRGAGTLQQVERSVRGGITQVEVNRSTQDLNTTRGSDSINYADALQKIAEKAIRSSVVIYSVDTQGLQVTGLTAADSFHGNGPQLQELISSRSWLLRSRREGGELIAEQTGGFQVRNSNSYRFDRILEDQAGYYLIGYRPTEETFNRRFHHIKAKVKRSGMSVRSRFGFFGVTEEEASHSRLTTRDMTNLALASPFEAQNIEVDLTSFFANDKTAGSIVRSFVFVSPKDLAFTKVDDLRQASIEFHSVIFGNNGAIVEQLKRGATIRFSESEYAHVVKNGLGFSIDLPVKWPGDYQVRVAIRDRTSSQIGSAGQFVEVPDLQKKNLAVSGIVLGTVAGDVRDTMANPGTRRFAQNSNLHFAYVIYNASQFVNAVAEARLFRDGKNVYSGPAAPVQTANQPDPDRLFVNSALRLADLEPGNYYLQVVISDKAGDKKKIVPVVQWIDFEIVKAEPDAAAPVK